MSGVKVLFGLLADAANISADGNLNVLGAFSDLNVLQFPSFRPVAYIVIRLVSPPQS
jgi:hypothetical protein